MAASSEAGARRALPAVEHAAAFRARPAQQPAALPTRQRAVLSRVPYLWTYDAWSDPPRGL